MSRYRIYLLFSLVVGAGLAAAILVSMGYYPIALVNGGFITARQFVEDYAAISSYYGNFLEANGLAKDERGLAPVELELAALNGLIEKRLIGEGARAEAGEDFGHLILKKLENFMRDTETQKAAEMLGLGEEEFEDLVLLPEAEKEILAGRLFLRGEKFEDWLKTAKLEARVIIFSPRFSWNGGAVVLEQ